MKTIERETIKEGLEVNEIYHKNPWAELYDEIKGVQYIKLNTAFENKSFRLNFLLNIYFARKQLKKLVSKDDKIIIFSPNYLLYIPKKILKTNTVILVQTNKMEVYFTKYSKPIFKKYSKYLDYFAIFTQYDMEKLKNIFPDTIEDIKAKVKYIPRACTISPPEKEKKIGKNLIVIGRIMEDQKNFSGLIEVMKLLPKGFYLNIYGNGPEIEIKKLQAKIANFNNIKFHGPTTNVKEKLEESNLFLMTSFYEGFSNTLVEARSQGLPIVAYDTFEALQWLVKDGENGFIIPFEDTQKFADAILKILSSETKYSEMSRAAIKMSESTEYSKVMAKWMEIIR
jgi:glycosyltransferase involved in cell wall biosynthesis